MCEASFDMHAASTQKAFARFAFDAAPSGPDRLLLCGLQFVQTPVIDRIGDYRPNGFALESLQLSDCVIPLVRSDALDRQRVQLLLTSPIDILLRFQNPRGHFLVVVLVARMYFGLHN